MPDDSTQQYFRFGSVEPTPSTEFAESLPGPAEDLRFVRPYFVVPFLDNDETEIDAADALEDATKRIEDKLANLPAAVSDIYIISHGWHRNLYSAAAAYDRLMSRFATLVRRGRILPPENWNPLFLTLHWHSDLGKNDWVDQAGRRDKASFMRLVFERIEPRTPETDPGEMRTVFEEAFEFFVKVCAPEIDPFAQGLEKDSRRIGKFLEDYTIRDARSATREEVISAVWTCYHGAEISKPVTEQDEPPSDFTPPFTYLMAVLKIVASVVGVGALLGMVVRNKWIGDRWESLEDWIEGTVARFYPPYLDWKVAQKSIAWILALYVFCWIILGIVAFLYRRKVDPDEVIAPGPALDPRRRRERQAKGLKLSGTVAWGLLQAFHSLPILVYCLVSPLFASPLLQLVFVGVALYFAQTSPWLYAVAVLSVLMFVFARFQFQERSMLVGEKATGSSLASLFKVMARPVAWLRKILVKFARLPAKSISQIASPDDRAVPLWQAIDNQLAFWDMVDKAIWTAERSATWFNNLSTRNAKQLTGETRIHIFGHSHGGLLTMTLGRLLAYNLGPEQPRLHTVGTICGAFMSSWLKDERRMVDVVHGCIGCVYSRYDVANSFWYPLANIGRRAAGYVGLWMGKPHPAQVIGEPLPYASISSTPNLAHRVQSVGQDAGQAKVLNIDGSRLIFQGPTIPQGAHNDIFKDDVVQLLWSMTTFPEDRERFKPE